MHGRVGLGGVALSALLLFATGCATNAPLTIPSPSPAQEVDDLIATLGSDLARARVRELPGGQIGKREIQPSTLHTPDSLLASMVMPVAGLLPSQIRDSWGAPRDGGKRKHRGIDLFASKGTPIVAVADGVITFIGEQGLGGRVIWLSTDPGVSFYYAHLDRWAPGLFEGMSVRQGDLIGYVGNTGNAISTPPHLHFSVLKGEEAVNPYLVLRHASLSTARPILAGGLGLGAR